jgi:chromosome segregation ATPase
MEGDGRGIRDITEESNEKKSRLQETQANLQKAEEHIREIQAALDARNLEILKLHFLAKKQTGIMKGMLDEAFNRSLLPDLSTNAQQQIAELEAKVSKLQQEQAGGKLETENSRLAELTAQNEELRAEIAVEAADKGKLEAEISRLVAEIAVEAADKGKLEADISRLVAQIGILKGKIVELLAKIDELVKLNEEFFSSKNEFNKRTRKAIDLLARGMENVDPM